MTALVRPRDLSAAASPFAYAGNIVQEIISSTSALAPVLVCAASPASVRPGVFPYGAAIAFRSRHASWLAGSLLVLIAKVSAAELAADDHPIPTLGVTEVSARV
jgi:hypothetical protein